MKKILVPCDFSNQAIEAFRVALEIAQKSNGEVHLLHVIEVPVMHDTVLMPTLSFEETLFQELKANAVKKFSEMESQYADGFQNVRSEIVYGSTSIMILDYIKEKAIDLVVMGSKGSAGVEELVIGSNAEKIVRRSQVPVFVVKRFSSVNAIKNIVFPSTLEKDHEDLVMNVKKLQHFFGATLHILYVNTPLNFRTDLITEKLLDEFAKRYMLKDFKLSIYNENTEESGIINFTHSIGADMIAMGTHGRKGLAHIISGSVTEDVVNHVDCPIWTYTIK